MNLYQLGKDIQTILSRLQAIEERLDAVTKRRGQLPPLRKALTRITRDHPRDGGVYWIYNPFIDEDYPSPRLTADYRYHNGYIGSDVYFTNRSETDSSTQWRFTATGSGLFHIRNVGFPDSLDPAILAPGTGPFLSRRENNTPNGPVYVSGSVNNPGVAALWHVGYSPDETAYNIIHPDHPRSILHSRYLSGNYYECFCGPPNELYAGDVHLFEVS